MRKIFGVNIFFLVVVLLQLANRFLLSGFERHLSFPELLYISQVMFLIVPMIIYIKITNQSVKEVLKLNKLSLKDIVFTLAISLCILPINVIMSNTTAILFNRSTSLGIISKSGYSIAALIPLFIVSAIGEEMAIRGVVLSGYKNINIKKSAIITAVFFAALYMNYTQILSNFLLGIVFAYLVYMSKSILSSIIASFTINLGSIILINSNIEKGIFGINPLTRSFGLFLSIILCLICAVGIFMIIKRMQIFNLVRRRMTIDIDRRTLVLSNVIFLEKRNWKEEYIPAIIAIIVVTAVNIMY
ncbi:MAG: CPBP family intramembrane metalloprotease [Bacillota bacterium]|nr:CPBP family intramembrane metalloprotease [Bacillota bacterium]